MRDAQLVMQVQIRSREERVQARMRRTLKAFQRYVDVIAPRTRQRRHGAIADFARHGAHAFQISTRSDREAGLNDVHAKRFELPCHADFFRHGHGKSRRLFPIPQRRIEDAYNVHKSVHPPTLCISYYKGKRVKFIILVSAIKSYYIGRTGFSLSGLIQGVGTLQISSCYASDSAKPDRLKPVLLEDHSWTCPSCTYS